MIRPPSHPSSSPGRPPPGRGERGGATPLVAVALLLAAAVVVALVAAGGDAVDAARARTAADGAALAGAADGPDAARRVARANGAELLSARTEGDEVVVEVRVGRVSARARARREGTWCPAEPRPGPAISYTARRCRSSPG